VRFHLGTREVEVLEEGLSFANGLELGPGEEFLLFTETGRARLYKHTLKGAKAGETEHTGFFRNMLQGYLLKHFSKNHK